MDFVFDELATGRRVKTLTVVDDCTKESVQLVADDTSIPALHVTRVLDLVKAQRGLPEVIRTDNGPQFAGRKMHDWAARNGVELRFPSPASRCKTPISKASRAACETSACRSTGSPA